jgi:hypothetical protein
MLVSPAGLGQHENQDTIGSFCIAFLQGHGATARGMSKTTGYSFSGTKFSWAFCLRIVRPTQHGHGSSSSVSSLVRCFNLLMALESTHGHVGQQPRTAFLWAERASDGRSRSWVIRTSTSPSAHHCRPGYSRFEDPVRGRLERLR